MGKHLKRMASPRSWKIPRKTSTWVVKPNPGAHPMERGLALATIVKDYIKIADTTTEARSLIGARKVHVDGRAVNDYKFVVGLMDVISIPKTNQYFRMLIDNRNKLRLIPISAEEAKWKLVRIEDKTIIKGKKIQLNLHDGRNIVVDKSTYKTGDVLKIELPSQKVLDTFEFKQGNVALTIGGQHVGQVSTLAKFESAKNPEPTIVTVNEGYNTIKEYLFIVGRKSPEITLTGVVS
jgi:small subunit ribosomal protein S4e